MTEPLAPTADGAEPRKALAEYLAAQHAVQALRDRPQPELPWPAADNAMLDYLLDEAGALVADHGTEAALLWLAVHAWREGAIDERARIVRSLLG